MSHTTQRRAATALIAAGVALTAAACSGGNAHQSGSAAADADGHDHAESGHHIAQTSTEKTETAGRAPRLVSTYDGGILVVDANTLEEVADLPIDGFNRVSPAGDGRHVAVSTTGGWAFVDAGTWAQGHGDHFHYYNAQPAISDVLVKADTAGHAVAHGGKLSMWDDGGTGVMQQADVAALTDGVAAGKVDITRTFTPADGAYHGVGVALGDGNLLTTLGNADTRNGGQVLDASDKVLVSSDQCPGVHGEGTLGELAILGCEDGMLMFHGDHTHKIASPDAFGRIGNIFTVEDNPVVLGDYKQDKDMGIELDTISLVSTEGHDAAMKTVDTGTTYTWRGLARGTDGEVLVLGTDGKLQVRDAATGDLQRSVDVIDAWKAPEQWQKAHPQLIVVEGMAYVLDPAAKKVHAVDYVTGKVWKSADLSRAVNETTVATAEEPTAAHTESAGDATGDATGDAAESGHAGHDHADADHAHADAGHDHAEHEHDAEHSH